MVPRMNVTILMHIEGISSKFQFIMAAAHFRSFNRPLFKVSRI